MFSKIKNWAKKNNYLSISVLVILVLVLVLGVYNFFPRIIKSSENQGGVYVVFCGANLSEERTFGVLAFTSKGFFAETLISPSAIAGSVRVTSGLGFKK